MPSTVSYTVINLLRGIMKISPGLIPGTMYDSCPNSRIDPSAQKQFLYQNTGRYDPLKPNK